MATHQFLPDSPCGLACIPADDTVPEVAWPRYALRRLALLGTHLLAMVFGLVAVFCSESVCRRLVRTWARAMMRALGTRIEASGHVRGGGPALVVANHASQLDVTALLALHPMVVIAKDVARRDPIVGRLARNSGTIFVERSTVSLPAMVEQATNALRAGNSVLVFPEGRLRCSAPGGPFTSGAMQAAVNARVPVRPVLIQYRWGDGGQTPRASWLGEESLWASLCRVMRIRGLVTEVRVFADIDTTVVGDRKQLARMAKEPIDAAAAGVPDSCVAHAPIAAPRP